MSEFVTNDNFSKNKTTNEDVFREEDYCNTHIQK